MFEIESVERCLVGGSTNMLSDMDGLSELMGSSDWMVSLVVWCRLTGEPVCCRLFVTGVEGFFCGMR